MTGDEAREKIRKITGIQSEVELSIFINTSYQSLPPLVKASNLGEPFECIVLEHCLNEQNTVELDKVPESLKRSYGDVETEVKDAENILLGNKETTNEEVEEEQKEKKVVAFFLYTSEEEQPIGLNYGNRIIIFDIPDSVPEELYSKEIERNGFKVTFSSTGDIDLQKL